MLGHPIAELVAALAARRDTDPNPFSWHVYGTNPPTAVGVHRHARTGEAITVAVVHSDTGWHWAVATIAEHVAGTDADGEAAACDAVFMAEWAAAARFSDLRTTTTAHLREATS